MNITINNSRLETLRKFLEGGNMPAEEVPAEAPQGGEDPMALIIQAAAQAVQTQDANLALQVCGALVEMAGGGEEQAPAAPEGQAPVYKKGGKLARWIKK